MKKRGLTDQIELYLAGMDNFPWKDTTYSNLAILFNTSPRAIGSCMRKLAKQGEYARHLTELVKFKKKNKK